MHLGCLQFGRILVFDLDQLVAFALSSEFISLDQCENFKKLVNLNIKFFS